MFYKFLKFLFLSTLTLVWGGCDTKDDPVAGYGCFPTKCYNTTATNDAGKVFDIIECEDGEKFLRHPGLYGAPTIIRNAVEKCTDGSIRPSEEYAKFLKMKEEWEANKSALEEELKKVYEDKMKEIEARINKCLNDDL